MRNEESIFIKVDEVVSVASGIMTMIIAMTMVVTIFFIITIVPVILLCRLISQHITITIN